KSTTSASSPVPLASATISLERCGSHLALCCSCPTICSLPPVFPLTFFIVIFLDFLYLRALIASDDIHRMASRLSSLPPDVLQHLNDSLPSIDPFLYQIHRSCQALV